MDTLSMGRFVFNSDVDISRLLCQRVTYRNGDAYMKALCLLNFLKTFSDSHYLNEYNKYVLAFTTAITELVSASFQREIPPGKYAITPWCVYDLLNDILQIVASVRQYAKPRAASAMHMGWCISSGGCERECVTTVQFTTFVK